MGSRKCFKISFTPVMATKILWSAKILDGYSRLSSPTLRSMIKQKELLKQIWRVLNPPHTWIFCCFCQKFDIESQKQNLPNAPSVLINTESSISFLQSQKVPFLLSLFSSKKVLEIKAVWSKHFIFTSLQFFQCSESSQQNV